MHSENVHKLVLCAPLYNFNDHTNLRRGSVLQNKRKPHAFNFAIGAYPPASEAANTDRWNGEILVENQDEYREPAVSVEFWKECLASDPSNNTRNPELARSQRRARGFVYHATGRPLWHVANIYAPTLVIAGQFDTSFPEDREGPRDLVHASAKRSVLIPDATNFVLFEKQRTTFFED